MSFQKRLASGEFVVLAEMDVPKGVDISTLVSNVRKVKGRVDAVVIPDMSNGVMKMSGLGASVLMQQQGVEAVMQMCCRDRNRIALQGDLLSAHVLGVQNIIAVKGDDLSQGDQIDAKPVEDIDELGLLEAIRSMQSGKDLAGIELSGSPSFTVGCVMPPVADDAALTTELDRAKMKIDAGASFVIAPPVFDAGDFDAFLAKAKGLGVPVIPTVYLLKSVGMARYMNTNIPGMHVSENIIKRIRQSSDRVHECVVIAGETTKALKKHAQGVYIVTLGWEFRLPAILDIAGI